MIMDKDLLKKFNVKQASAVQLINAPNDFHFSQSGVEEIAIVFVKSQQDIEHSLHLFAKRHFQIRLLYGVLIPRKARK
jgi:hypothetical protein